MTELEQTGFSVLLSDKKLEKALKELKITEPTEVQELTIPYAVDKKDLIVEAQTGSGKTLAFMLPIIMRIRTESVKRGTTAIVVCPTRELALQVKRVVESIASDITPACIIGGSSAREQEQQLRKDDRIIVGTPGRILDFMRQRVINLRNCKTFVLDEADEMLGMGFLDEVRDILQNLPKQRQGMFFSATITGRVSSLASSFLKNPKTITVAKNEENTPDIEHCFCRVDVGLTAKAQALTRLFENIRPQSAIVFCNTKSDTELVEVFLKRRGFDARKINSDLTQKERDKVLTSLRSGELKYLIATDVAARGIDIKGLDLVINYTLPKENEVYTHRTGRTGRAGASGKAISLIAPQDTAIFHLLNRFRAEEMKEIPLPPASAQIAAA
jgi:ATP-dependent RNA helicase DeaD